MIDDHLTMGRCDHCDRVFAYRPRLMTARPLCKRCVSAINRERSITHYKAIDIDPMAYQPIKERRK